MTDREGEDGPSYSHLLGRLLKDGERFAKTRLRLYRALFYLRVEQAKRPLAALAVAALLAIGGAIALTLGIVSALAIYTGPLLAGTIVAAVMLGVAALLARHAAKTMPDMSDLPFEDDDLIIPEQEPVPEQLLVPEEHERSEP